MQESVPLENKRVDIEDVMPLFRPPNLTAEQTHAAARFNKKFFITIQNLPFSIEIFNTRIFPSRHFANNFFNASLAKTNQPSRNN